MNNEDLAQRALAEIQMKLKSEGFATGSSQDLLFYVGIREASLPPQKLYSDVEKQKIIEMATYTILCPARYYELIWVDDQGWPHYRPKTGLPKMTKAEFEVFITPFLLNYFLQKKR